MRRAWIFATDDETIRRRKGSNLNLRRAWNNTEYGVESDAGSLQRLLRKMWNLELEARER